MKRLLFRCVLWAARLPLQKVYSRTYQAGEKSIVNRVTIIGPIRFRECIAHALDLLSAQDPVGNSLVQRYIMAVVASNQNEEVAFVIKVAYIAANDDGLMGWPPSRIAAYLVRMAVYVRLLDNNVCYARNDRARSLACRNELRALRLLECSTEYIHEQEEHLRAVSPCQIPPGKP